MSLHTPHMNPFQLLDEDFDPSTLNLSVKETKAPVKSAPAKAASQGVKSTQQSTGSPRDSRRGDRQNNGPRGERQNNGPRGERQNNGPRGDRQDNRPRGDGQQRQGGDRYPEGQRGERQNRGPRQPRGDTQWGSSEGTEQNTDANEAAVRSSYDRDQPRDNESRGDQRRRSYPSSAGGFVGNKRYNDRKSANGRPPREEKRGGHGRGNWGAEDGSDDPATTEEAKEIGEGETATEGEKTHVEEQKEKTPREETEEEKAKREEREKEAKQMTLSAYLKLREEKRSASTAFKPLEARKANEGVDATQQKAWTSQVIKKDDAPSTAATTEGKAQEKTQDKDKKAKNVRLDTIFSIKEQPRRQFDDDRRERRDNRRERTEGDRPPRDNRPRGDKKTGSRAQQPQQQASTSGSQVDFSDQSFPSLKV